MIEDDLNKNAIRTLKWAVHLYTFIGYWFLTNRQIFYDEVYPTKRRSAREITGHSIYNIKIDHTFPLFVFMFMLLGFMLLRALYYLIKRLVFSDTKNKYLRNYENLYTYYDSLEPYDIKTLIAEERNTRKNLGYGKMPDTTLALLKNSKNKRENYWKILNRNEKEKLEEKTIFNLYTFDQLLNFRYQDLYQYVPVVYRDTDIGFGNKDRKDYEEHSAPPLKSKLTIRGLQAGWAKAIDSDYVRRIVDLPYWYEDNSKNRSKIMT